MLKAKDGLGPATARRGCGLRCFALPLRMGIAVQTFAQESARRGKTALPRPASRTFVNTFSEGGAHKHTGLPMCDAIISYASRLVKTTHTLLS